MVSFGAIVGATGCRVRASATDGVVPPLLTDAAAPAAAPSGGVVVAVVGICAAGEPIERGAVLDESSPLGDAGVVGTVDVTVCPDDRGGSRGGTYDGPCDDGCCCWCCTLLLDAAVGG